MNTVENPTAAQTNAPGNVSLDQLTTMLKGRKQAAASTAAAKGTAGAGSSAVDGSQGERSGEGESGRVQDNKGKGSKVKVQSTREVGSSSGGSEEVQSEELGVQSGGDGGAAEGEEAAQEGLRTEDSGLSGEAEGEVPAEGEAAAEGEEAAEPDVPKAIREMGKRIDKLTAKLRSAEKQRDEALASKDTERAEARTPNAGGVDPRFAGDKELGSVVTQLESASAIVRWGEEALDEMEEKGSTEVEFSGKSFTKSQVRKLVREAGAQRVELTAAKAQRVAGLEASFNKSLGQFNRIATEAYPWMKDENSEEFQEAVEVLNTYRSVLTRPDRALAVADLVAGRRARLAKAAKGKEGAIEHRASSIEQGALKKAKPAPLPVSGSAAVAQRGAGERAAKARVDEAGGQFKKSGRTEDLAAWLRTRREAVGAS